jgi:hypothetical protein
MFRLFESCLSPGSLAEPRRPRYEAGIGSVRKWQGVACRYPLMVNMSPYTDENNGAGAGICVAFDGVVSA